MKLSRVEEATTKGHSGKASSLKRAMRVARVLQKDRPLNIRPPEKMVRGRKYVLTPTKGWRLA